MVRQWIAIACVMITHGFSIAQEPWAVITGQSIIEVRGGLRHIYQRLGRKDLVAALDSTAITNLVSGNLKGLDLARPLGSVILPNQSGSASILTFIPVTSDQGFIEFLRRHLLTPRSMEKGLHVIEVPLLGSVYLRVDKNYAWLALSQTELQQALPEVSTLIPKNHRQHQLAATIYLDRIPADQKQALVQRGGPALQMITHSSTNARGQIFESVALPAFSTLIKRLADDSSQITMLATSDRVADLLSAKIMITPRPDRPWLNEVKNRAESPIRIELPPYLWAKLRGTSASDAEKAAQSAFKNGKADPLVLSVNGGSQLELKAEVPGTLLAYHAALDETPTRVERQARQRERRRDIRR